jgi:phenylacetate-CoA ligase
LDHIFKDALHVREAQIIQEKAGEIILRIVKESGFTSMEENMILKETENRLGASTLVMVQYVDSIPREQNGKFRFVISSINQKISSSQNLKVND